MELTKLMTDLDKAVDAVEEKKQALDAAQAEAKAVVERASTAVNIASQAHTDAVGKAQQLRRDLNKALNTALPAEPAGVTVNG